MIDYVTAEKFAEEVGMTPAAVSKATCRWPEGLVWIKVDGRIYFSKSGWNKWLGQAAALSKSQHRQSKSNSHTKVNGAGSVSSATPLPPIFDA